MGDSDIYQDITPDELRAFRNRLALSQRALALALRMSTRGIEEWESGRRTPPPYLRLALERLTITKAVGGYAQALRDMLPVEEIVEIANQLRPVLPSNFGDQVT
jgi:transcriptional regulator with XRE-family HTH domain